MFKSIAKVFVFLGLKLMDLVKLTGIAAGILMAGGLFAVAFVFSVFISTCLGMIFYHIIPYTWRLFLGLSAYVPTTSQYTIIGLCIILVISGLVVCITCRETISGFFKENWERACEIVEGETK